jgi:hypothetical protein
MKARIPPNPTFALLSALAENGWLLLIRGIAAIAFGVLVFLWPDLTLLTLPFLCGCLCACRRCLCAGSGNFRQGRRNSTALVARPHRRREVERALELNLAFEFLTAAIDSSGPAYATTGGRSPSGVA